MAERYCLYLGKWTYPVPQPAWDYDPEQPDGTFSTLAEAKARLDHVLENEWSEPAEGTWVARLPEGGRAMIALD